MRLEHWFYTVPLRLRSLFRRGRVEQELDEEFQYHLERQIQEHIAKGLTPEEARYAALRAMGGLEQRKEECRDMRRVSFIEDLVQDLRYGLRVLRRSPGFTAVAVLSLALGVGANTAIFGLLYAVILRMLPVRDPEQLVLVNAYHLGKWDIISYPVYREMLERQQVFSDLVASRDYSAEPLRVRLGNSGAVQAVRGGSVSGNYFSVLGVSPILGRVFAAEDDRPGTPATVAVVSYSFWERELAGDPSAVGRVITINELLFTIIGVAPRGFSGVSVGTSVDVWVPLTQFRSSKELSNRKGTFFKLMARLRPGISRQQAEAGMTLLLQQLGAEELMRAGNATAEKDTRISNYRVQLDPGDKGFGYFRELLSKPLSILMGMVGFVLMIACLNLANLLLARATARQKEIALRLALGAGRVRLIRQLLTEGVLLATLGGAFGLIFAAWGSEVLLRFVATGIALHSGFTAYVPPDLQFQLNWRILGFTGGVSLLTGILFGLAPALRLTRMDLTSAMKQKATAMGIITPASLRLRLSKVLVVSQVAFSVVLLIGAGLMIRTVWNLHALDPGFDRENVLLVDVAVEGIGYKGAQLIDFERMLDERLNSIPGVRSASLSWLSLFSDTDLGFDVAAEGYTPRPGEVLSARCDVVSPRYFETVGMRILLGRSFAPQDTESSPKVAVINETLARRFFPNQNPLGKRIAIGRKPDWKTAKEIVGVVKDAKYNDLRQNTKSMYYVPLLQTPTSAPRSIEIRSIGNPIALVSEVRRAVREANENLVINDVKTLTDQVDRTLVQERLIADLSSFFSIAALLLTCIGLYGVMAYSVGQRTNEIGIRMALGAKRVDVIWMVLRDGLLLVGIGVAIGVPVALGLARLVSSLLFGLSPTDPLTISAAAIILFVVAAIASYLPSRRASCVDPMVALRYE